MSVLLLFPSPTGYLSSMDIVERTFNITLSFLQEELPAGARILDQHCHEFETWQFDRLIEKSGWQIQKTTTWTGPKGRIGIRPSKRRYAPRYYGVSALKTKS